MQRRFEQLDVFTDRVGFGNPLAVVVDGDGLDDDDMARFSRWTNLSETTFLVPPTDDRADYRVRIWSLGTELPFAGHPTIGSCRAWLNHGGEPRSAGTVVQECGIGLVELRHRDEQLAFAAPPLRRSGAVEPDVVKQIRQALGVDLVATAWGDNGPGWVIAELADATAVREATPEFSGAPDLKLGIFGREPGADFDIEVRAFFPSDNGRFEDPVTGSLNAAIAVWLAGRDSTWQSYRARQGTALGRRGNVLVERDGDTIWVGGPTVTAITGTVEL